LTEELRSSRDELAKPQHALSSKLIESAVTSGLRFIEQQPDLFDNRVRSGKIIEAHGDLRPEHICLEPEPVIIDCLEFQQEPENSRSGIGTDVSGFGM
jgi:aminoglycoside phosphotransferase family enzyme